MLSLTGEQAHLDRTLLRGASLIQGMRRFSTSLLFFTLTVSACGLTNAPAVERGVTEASPKGRPTALPVVASPAESVHYKVPVNQADEPSTAPQSRPMGDATSAPAVPNLPGQAVPPSSDRCTGPAQTDSKAVPSACPPQ